MEEALNLWLFSMSCFGGGFNLGSILGPIRSSGT